MKAKIPGLLAMGRLVWPEKRLLTNLERSKSTWRMVGLLLLALSSTPAVSGIVFTTDTSSTLIGNFSATTFPDHIEVTPGTFNLALGGDAGCNVLFLVRETAEAFGAQCASSPSKAVFFLPSVPTSSTSFADLAGFYNIAGGEPVTGTYFRFWDLADTGGADGTFSGNFCFSRDTATCVATVPEPGTLALLGLGLAGLGLSRRRKSD